LTGTDTTVVVPGWKTTDHLMQPREFARESRKLLSHNDGVGELIVLICDLEFK